ADSCRWTDSPRPDFAPEPGQPRSKSRLGSSRHNPNARTRNLGVITASFSGFRFPSSVFAVFAPSFFRLTPPTGLGKNRVYEDSVQFADCRCDRHPGGVAVVCTDLGNVAQSYSESDDHFITVRPYQPEHGVEPKRDLEPGHQSSDSGWSAQRSRDDEADDGDVEAQPKSQAAQRFGRHMVLQCHDVDGPDRAADKIIRHCCDQANKERALFRHLRNWPLENA